MNGVDLWYSAGSEEEKTCFRTSDKDGKLGWLRDVSPPQGLLQSAICADWRSDFRRLKKPLRGRNVSQPSQFPVFVWCFDTLLQVFFWLSFTMTTCTLECQRTIVVKIVPVQWNTKEMISLCIAPSSVHTWLSMLKHFKAGNFILTITRVWGNRSQKRSPTAVVFFFLFFTTRTHHGVFFLFLSLPLLTNKHFLRLWTAINTINSISSQDEFQAVQVKNKLWRGTEWSMQFFWAWSSLTSQRNLPGCFPPDYGQYFSRLKKRQWENQVKNIDSCRARLHQQMLQEITRGILVESMLSKLGELNPGSEKKLANSTFFFSPPEMWEDSFHMWMTFWQVKNEDVQSK